MDECQGSSDFFIFFYHVAMWLHSATDNMLWVVVMALLLRVLWAFAKMFLCGFSGVWSDLVACCNVKRVVHP